MGNIRDQYRVVYNPLDATNRWWYSPQMKSSRWNRYDASNGLWISSNKRIYTYWFKFLQHAENDPNIQVDWSGYEGWGGADVILNTKFDAWWKKNWKTLFGYKQGETEPLYSLSTPKPQPDGVRYSLLVYELKNQPLLKGQKNTDEGIVGDYWEIAKRIAVLEYPRRRDKGKKDLSYKPEDWSFNIARPIIGRELRKSNRVEFNKQRRTMQSRVGRYMRSAKHHLDNVCEGRFP
jgi:hypothetical protein